MDMKKIQELPTPEDLKKEFPLPYKVQKIKKQRDQEIEDIFTGKDTFNKLGYKAKINTHTTSCINLFLDIYLYSEYRLIYC